MLLDTHAHLNDPRFDEDRAEVIARAVAAGVGRIVEIADSPAEWDRAVALSRARPGVIRCSLGLHPYYADGWTPELAERLLRKARLPEVVAAGEFGLDYAKCEIPKETQIATLKEALVAADAAGLPVVLHCREAYADMMPLLSAHYGGRAPRGRFHGVLHCFAGDRADAEQAVALGFALGVDGPITYPKNDALRGAVRAAGLANLVVETDSPWLPPQSRRGKRNEPALVGEVAARLAGVFGADEKEIARATTVNAGDLFGFSSRP